MLRLLDLALARGVNVLYKNVSLIAPPGERIGLVGANGCGKSTLFAAILGELSLEAGQLETPPAARIAHVAQDIEATDDTALDYVLGGHAPLTAARAELAAAEAAHDDMRLAQAHATLAELNEGAVAAQALTVMHGLGFADAVTRKQVREFSGGWRNRLALARALLRPADLLLLDEPTNHLDLDSVVWLENWLKRQEATVLVISHDREFLDRCTETTWNVAEGTIRRYAGNYSAFETAYLEQLKQQDAAAKSYERSAAHLQKFIDRFRAQATKARQAQSRVKMLEKLQAVEPARARREWRFEFPEPVKLPERLLDAEDLRLGYRTPDGERTILDRVKFLVRSGDRIGILGVNGAGKSTLVKAIAGELAAAGGELRRGAGLAIGYFAQHQLDQLRPDETPLQHLRRIAMDSQPNVREQELRDFLGQYRFSGELATRAVGPMSGGEKARCALALIAWHRPNLLLLDEPTNHLDMETREALTMALSSFGGALVLVSHDRHLLRATTDQLWLVHDGRVAEFDGDLDDYAALVLAARRDDGNGSSTARSDNAPMRKEQRKAEAAERQRVANARKPLQNRLTKVEKELASVSSELRELDARLADPAFYHAGDADEVAALIKRRGELAPRVDQLEEQWLAIQTELEAIQ
ncbi:MAG: ATP-binding cassette domain-containing protein [Burkholderiaceae bacterium]|jgi:ATP-binding cassette subfamily F protein 3|nr:ATP-binding cassette domain-containing protein [Burkholderiaceae bacterium]